VQGGRGLEKKGEPMVSAHGKRRANKKKKCEGIAYLAGVRPVVGSAASDYLIHAMAAACFGNRGVAIDFGFWSRWDLVRDRLRRFRLAPDGDRVKTRRAPLPIRVEFAQAFARNISILFGLSLFGYAAIGALER